MSSERTSGSCWGIFAGIQYDGEGVVSCPFAAVWLGCPCEPIRWDMEFKYVTPVLPPFLFQISGFYPHEKKIEKQESSGAILLQDLARKDMTTLLDGWLASRPIVYGHQAHAWLYTPGPHRLSVSRLQGLRLWAGMQLLFAAAVQHKGP